MKNKKLFVGCMIRHGGLLAAASRYAVAVCTEYRDLVGFILILSKFVDAYTGLPFAMVDASAGMVSVDRVEKILSAEEEPSGEGCADAETRAAENVISFEQVDFSLLTEKNNVFIFITALYNAVIYFFGGKSDKTD